MNDTTRARFLRAQAAYRLASEACEEYERDLRIKYGSRGVLIWCSPAEQRKHERLKARKDRASDRVFAVLEKAPREWRSGAPAHWICEKLDVADAFRPLDEPLSVTPPIAFMHTEPIK